MAASAGLADLAARFWAFQCREYPLTALQAGVGSAADDVFFESVADHERRAEAAGALRDELALLRPDGLSPRDAVTQALLARELDHLVHLVQTDAHLRPSLFPFGADMMALRLGSVASIADAAQAMAYVARMRAIPRAIAGFVATLRSGVASGVRHPRPVLERALAQARALVGMPPDVHPLLDPFRRSAAPPAELMEARSSALSVLADDVAPAIGAYADVIARELTAAALDTLAEHGAAADARYRLAIAFFASVDDTPDEIHAFGLSEVERLTAEIAEVAAEAGFGGDPDGLRRHATSGDVQPSQSAAALRCRIEALAKRIDARIPEIVGRVPRSTYGVRSIPERLATSLPPAYAQPNPADNTAAGILWITPLPNKLPAHLHTAITLHEGWPGHLMHVALIQEQDDLPDFLRFNATRYSAYLEGWALYCEWLGEALGLYETPLERFGRLDMEMWRACRLVVDTGLHARGWSRDRAVAYLCERVSLPQPALEAEVDRYIGWPAQALSYQLGNRMFRALRREAEGALGGRFDLRAFHDCLLQTGPVTLPILEGIVRAWIGSRRREAPAGLPA